MSQSSTPQCLACGACCFGDGERYVPVTGADHTRLAGRVDELTRFIGNRCYMRMRDDHCEALELRTDGSFVCAVYALRPQVCRDLKRHSGACQAELSQKRARSQAAMLRVLQ